MKKYKIAFVDEDPQSLDEFNLYFEHNSDEVEIVSVNPDRKTVEDIIDEVLSNKCDAVAIDYYLKYEKSGVLFNGDELLIRFKERKLNLPLLIFTSKRSKAEQGFMSMDTLICDKSEINDIDDPSFKNKLIEHIDFYKELTNKIKEEFAELRLKQSNGEKLTSKEKKRVIELNNLIEEMGDRQLLVMPVQDNELEQISTLINQTREVVDKLSKK